MTERFRGTIAEQLRALGIPTDTEAAFGAQLAALAAVGSGISCAPDRTDDDDDQDAPVVSEEGAGE